MKRIILSSLVFLIAYFATNTAAAHFGMVIPSDSMVMPNENRVLAVVLSFSHPFEGFGMTLKRPKLFMVMAKGKRQDLLNGLQKSVGLGSTVWKASYKIKRPGSYTFFMEPEPYWEASEDCFIIHYTKTTIAAFGDDEGWGAEVGLKTEIVALSKPFGLYVGNVFQGTVKLNGKAVPFAEVEVEYYNEDLQSTTPTEYMITQSIKADQNGLFTYGVPKAGWWGFAALSTADYTIQYRGKAKEVELGAVIWVRFHNWKMK